MSEPPGYFITFTTYATRLHGDEQGSVERGRDGTGSRELEPNPAREADEALLVATQHPGVLEESRRRLVAATIEAVATFKGWMIHALNVRSNHVHVVVSGEAKPELMMNAFKSWATRRLREAGLAEADTRLWTRHGSTRYLWDEDGVVAAGKYVWRAKARTLGAFGGWTSCRGNRRAKRSDTPASLTVGSRIADVRQNGRASCPAFG